MKKLALLSALALLLAAAPASAGGPFVNLSLFGPSPALSAGWARDAYRPSALYYHYYAPSYGAAPGYYAEPPYLVAPRAFVVPRYYAPLAPQYVVPSVVQPIPIGAAPSADAQELGAHVQALKKLLDQEARIRALETRAAEPPAAEPRAKLPPGQKLEVREEKK